jgi:serine/threonine protein kinase
MARMSLAASRRTLMTNPDRSYADLMSTAGPIDVDEVIRVGIAIAAALQATHVAGRLHGRLTPAGIVRGPAGPALSDEGYAMAGEPASIAVAAFMPYASPEVLLGDAQDARSDIYSLAATMWTMLAGHPPFAVAGGEPDLDDHRERVLREPAPSVPVADVPGWLRTSLRRAMARQPEDRYPTAGAFADALRSHSNQPWAPLPAPAPAPALDTPQLESVHPLAPTGAIPHQRTAPEAERTAVADEAHAAGAGTSGPVAGALGATDAGAEGATDLSIVEPKVMQGSRDRSRLPIVVGVVAAVILAALAVLLFLR